MAQKYSNNEIPNFDADWGQDLNDEKLRPYSNGAVQRFLKSKIQEQMSALEGKIGWLRYEGGNITFYDKQDGNAIGSITLSGTIYSIKLQSDTSQTFFVLTTEDTHYISITPSSKSGELGGSMSDFIEDYTYTVSVDNGNGSFKEILSGTCVNGYTIRENIRNYITTGTNRIRFIVTGNESGQSKAQVFTCTLTNLSLTCNFSWWKPFIQGQNYYIDNIYFGGNLAKTLYVMINDDEEQLYNINFSSGTNYLTTGYQFSMSDKFPNEGTGVHKVEIWMAGDGVETPHYVYNMMCIEESDVNQVSLVCINNIVSKAANYHNQTLFQYATYNAVQVTFNITGSDNGIPVNIVTDQTLRVQTQSRTNYDINLELDTESKDGVSITVFATVPNLTEQITIPVDNTNSYAAVDNPTFHLDATNRSNGAANRYEFINSSRAANTVSSYNANWLGFAWSNDGWATDTDGNKCLVVNAGSSVEVPDFKPLIAASALSSTIEFKFRCSNIANYDEPIMTIIDTDTYNEGTSNGIILFPTKILVMTNVNKQVTPQSVNLDEDEITHIAIVLQRNYNNSGRNLCRIYVNSYQNAVFEYGGNASFGDGCLKLGQQSADTYLYMFRYYENRVLEESDVLGNFMNVLIDNDEFTRTAVRRDNNIIDSGNINYDLCKKAGYNIMIVETQGDAPIPSIEHTAAIKTKLSLEYNDHPEWNFTIENASCDGQGTTSKKYYRWNLRWKLKDNSLWTYADGTTSNKSGYFDGNNHPKVNKITAKKNVASSSQGHKMGATNMYDDLYREVGLKAGLPSTSTRVAVYQYPVMGFQKFENNSYEFIGLFTIGPDKGDKKTFGYDDKKYPSYLSLEGPNHNPLATRFLHPWTQDTIFNPNEETLEFGGQEGWDVDACPYETDVPEDQSNIQTLLEAEWKPAYDIVYFCSPYVRSLDEIGYTLAELNLNKLEWRNSMEILGTRKNEVLSLYDSNYDLIYYDNAANQYKKLNVNGTNHNVVSYLSGYLNTANPTTDEIIAARKAKFYAEAGNYWSIDGCTFHSCYCELTGATDNHAKNSYPFKLKTLAEGGRWSWRQDDLDTIMATDNNGQSTKSYSIEVGDITGDGTDIFQGASSVLWTLIDDVFAAEKKAMMVRIFDGIQRVATEHNISASYLHDTVFNVFRYYFWSNASEYFPSLSYNKDATYSYITPWFLDPTKSYNNVFPLTQALGTQKDAEELWVKRRIVYIMSLYQIGGFTGSANDGYGSIEFTPAQTFTFHVKPAIAMYPSGNKGGGENIKGGRTAAGQPCDIVADSDGSTTFYLKAVDLLTDIGDLSGLRLTTRGGDSNIGASLSISSKKLKRLKIGDENPNNVQFNASSLAINGPCIEEIDARNVTTLSNNVSLLNCPRLKRAYFEGTNVSAINLPQGAKITEISYPDGLQTLFLHSLPLLTDANMKLTSAALQSITGFYYYNCPNLSPFSILRNIYNNGGNLRFVTIIWDGVIQGTNADLQMLLRFTTPYNPGTGEGYGSIEFDETNNLVSNSVQRTDLQGSININGYGYEDTIKGLKDYFGANLNINVLGYYLRFVDAILQQILLDNGIGDGVGIMKADCESATSIPSFQNNEDITSFDELKYFTKITNIPNYNFNNCTSLKSIDLTNIKTVGFSAFNNSGLQNIHNTDNIVRISQGGFLGTHITDVNLPNLQTIYSGSYKGAFGNCQELESITSLGNLEDLRGDYYNVNDGRFGGAFSHCINLTKVNLPETLKTIGTAAFHDCSSLKTIDLKNVTNIWDIAFKNCTALTDITANNVTTIGREVFMGCTSLKSISLPNATTLDNNVFNTCSSLTSLSLPNATTIGTSCFERCTSLTSLSLPNATTIGNTCFRRCTSLTSIDLPKLANIGDLAFNGPIIEELSLPSLTTMNNAAFRECTAKKITSLGKITTINANDSDAWFGNIYFCPNLIELHLPVTLTSLSKYSIGNNYKLTDIYYDGTIAQWNAITKADGWHGTMPAKVIHCTDGDCNIE